MSETARPALPRLHLVTNDAVLQRADFAAVAADLMRCGGERVALHLRGHATPASGIYALAEQLVRCAAECGAMVIVNDRVDVAIAAGAAGVQLGARSLPLGIARRLLGSQRSLGASIHSAVEGKVAVTAGADFLIAGSIWRTESHPGVEGRGTAALREMAQLGLPTIAIGGVGEHRVGELRSADAYGAAVIRAVWDAADPLRVVRRMLSLLYG